MNLKSIASTLSGEILIPGSKSHTIRAFVLSALAKGQSRISGALLSNDTESCKLICSQFGVEIISSSANSGEFIINGVGLDPKFKTKTFDVGNSGTSLRLLSSVGSLWEEDVVFTGDESICSRPMKPLLSALKELGAKVEFLDKEGYTPFKIKGPICGGDVEIDGITSQYLSSLLFAAPLARDNTTIRVYNLHEKPYVEMTLWWLDKMGIQYERKELDYFEIKGRQSYSPFNISIPADFSTACFPLVAAAITQSKVEIKGLDFTDTQGDKIIFSFVKKMGVKIQEEKDSVTVDATNGILKGITMDLNATPDALPVLSVLGCFAKGKTILTNVAQARIKECDRIATMTRELRKMGAKIEEMPDGMIIEPSQLTGARVHGHHDHRIVMALIIAGMGASGETTVDTAEAASVTFPSFEKSFRGIGAKVFRE